MLCRTIVMLFCLLVPLALNAAPVDPVDPDERCPVCGMKVAKYPSWIAQLHAVGEPVVMFDGVKDMMAYYFYPKKYDGGGDMAAADIWVKDYYSLQWIDGRKALYVVGSDVLGPMGDELIPFEKRDAADNFMKDHQGKTILAFDDIEAEMIMAMKKKHMMKMKKKKK